MFELPPTLARHFRDRSGRVDYTALLRTPDSRLLALARQLSDGERADLEARLVRFRPDFLLRLAAWVAGIDPDHERRRLLAILSAAVPALS